MNVSGFAPSIGINDFYHSIGEYHSSAIGEKDCVWNKLLEGESECKPYIIGIDMTLVKISQQGSEGRVLVVKDVEQTP